MEIDIQSIDELDPDKIYHIALAADAAHDTIQRFALAVKTLGLRALITRSGVNFQAFETMFVDMPEASKARLLAVLQTKVVVNPLDHEQSK